MPMVTFYTSKKHQKTRWFQEISERDQWHEMNSVVSTQPATTCSKLTIETLELGVEYVQS